MYKFYTVDSSIIQQKTTKNLSKINEHYLGILVAYIKRQEKGNEGRIPWKIY